jgi:ribose transport system ATP-binding protein
MTQEELAQMAWAIMTQHQRDRFKVENDLDMAWEVQGLGRFRVNVFTQARGIGMVLRQIPSKVLTLEERVDGDLVILLDEPTSVLAEDEVKMLFTIVRDLTKRASFIFVSHRMDEVMELSDRIYVMKDGAVVDVVAHGAATVEEIQHKMVGRNVDREYYREQRQKPYEASKVLLEMEGVSLPGRIKDIGLKLHAGEVLCLVGTEGAGREAILRTIYGMRTPVSGSVKIKGRTVTTFNPQDAVASGVGYVPRERKIEGIVAGMNVYENMTLSQIGRYSRMGVLNVSAEKALARDWIGKLSIKAHSEYADCGNLSGGNQQKVVLSKWRSGGSDIMLLDHPTRGLDIGAKEDVYEMIRDMSDDGVGVILVADTLEEAIGLSHSIIVLKDCAIQQRFDCKPGAKPSLFDILHYMI